MLRYPETTKWLFLKVLFRARKKKRDKKNRT